MIMDFKKKLVDAWERIANSLKWCWKPISPDAIFSLIMRPIVLVVVLIVLVVWHYCKPENATFVASLLGGILLLAQVRAFSQRAKAAEETAKAMQKTANLTEKGNIAERFKNAIEHLGHISPSIRLGGIYALHHIAQDEDDYRERVFEILCAHIRETTTQDGYKPQDLQKRKGSSGVLSRPSIEIQSVLKLLFTDSPGCDVYTGFVANLEYSNLKMVILRNANLQGANFSNANLNYAIFDGAELQGAHFEATDLQNANFSNANLDSASFIMAKLRRSHFDEADLQSANFHDANLQGADLESAKNLTVGQLLIAQTLYQIRLSDIMETRLNRHAPKWLKKPKPDNEPDT